MKKIYLEGGKVCNAHGVRGVLKVESWCDSPRVLASQKRIFLAKGDGEYEERRVLGASVSGALVLLTIEGVNSRDDAIGYKNEIVYLHRDDVPVKRGAMLVADMIGLDVIDVDSGVVYGKIVDVGEVPRGLLYTIKTDKGVVYFPSNPEFVKEIDAERGMFVHTIPGFFD